MSFTATTPYLDPEHPDASKYLRLVFQLKSPTGQQVRIRESLGFKATTENHKLTVKGKLRSLNLALLREDWPEVARLCPNNTQRFTELRLLDSEITASVAELLELHRKELVRNNKLPTPPSTRKHVLKHFGACAVVDVTPHSLVAYQDQRLSQGASNGTINRELSCLRSGFTVALRLGRITKAFPKVKFLKEAAPREGFFEEWEVRVLIKYLPEYFHNLVWTAYYTGWRKSELRNLKRTQLSADGVLTLAAGTTKNKQRREYYVNADPQLKAVLEAQKRRTEAEYPETEWLFHFEGQQICSRFGPWDTALKKAAVAGEIVGKRWFHNFRRTAITNNIASGMPVEHAKALSGHLTNSMVTRYNMNPRHLLEESLREAAALRAKRASTVEPIALARNLAAQLLPNSEVPDRKVEQNQGKLVKFPFLMNQTEK